MLPLIPIAIGIAAWRVYANKKNKGLTPERQAIYSAYMTVVKDPTKLNKMADIFDKGGMTTQASNLRARAKIPTVGSDVHRQRQKVFRKAMKLKDPKLAMKVAGEFEKRGMGSSAKMLQEYAVGLDTAYRIGVAPRTMNLRGLAGRSALSAPPKAPPVDPLAAKRRAILMASAGQKAPPKPPVAPSVDPLAAKRLAILMASAGPGQPATAPIPSNPIATPTQQSSSGSGNGGGGGNGSGGSGNGGSSGGSSDGSGNSGYTDDGSGNGGYVDDVSYQQDDGSQDDGSDNGNGGYVDDGSDDGSYDDGNGDS